VRRLKRLMEISNADRLLLFRAFFVVASARLVLWVLSSGSARRVVSMMARSTQKISIDRFVWAVKVVSAVLPRATCLTQAIAVQAMLARQGHASSVEIGIAKDNGRLEAHAWVVCGNHIVIGGPDITRYSYLGTWNIESNGAF